MKAVDQMHNDRKKSFLSIGSILLFVLAAASLMFLLIPIQETKGKLKTLYFWAGSFVDKLHYILTASSAQVLMPVRVMPATGPLRIDTENPRYFSDGSGRAILLTGSHTWANFQDNGGGYPPPVFDYNAYLDFLVENNHNFFRLWTWEQSRWTSETPDENYWFHPAPPFLRTGPDMALDGQPKFDLKRWDQAYFDRMRQRVIAAGDRGIYVSVMLFNGWSATEGDPRWGAGRNNPWKGHPFNKNNNVNGINGDPNGDNQGFESYDLSNPAVTAVQEAYIRKVIDTVNDLDNVLYEICNECGGTKNWQYYLIDFIHTYEKGKHKQHPVGMTHIGDDAALLDSPADWISIQNDTSLTPPVADGSKVSLLDTDHICGVCGDRTWVWEAFAMGHNPIFMDPYDGTGYGVGGAGFVFNDPRWVSTRANMGYALTYANRMNLDSVTPRPELCSTGYCLANAASSGAEYLAYLPSGGSITMDLRASAGTLIVEWFNPERGTTINGDTVSGGTSMTFVAPFSGDAVLYIYQAGIPSPTAIWTDTPALATPIETTQLSTQEQIGTVPPISQTPPDISPSQTPTPPSSTWLCAQGLLGLGGLFLMVVRAGSLHKERDDR